jgi:hypothetical protein
MDRARRVLEAGTISHMPMEEKPHHRAQVLRITAKKGQLFWLLVSMTMPSPVSGIK